MSKLLLECIPNAGSKARKFAKAMSLAGVSRRVQCTRRSEDMQHFKKVSRTRTIKMVTECQGHEDEDCVRVCVRARVRALLTWRVNWKKGSLNS